MAGTGRALGGHWAGTVSDEIGPATSDDTHACLFFRLSIMIIRRFNELYICLRNWKQVQRDTSMSFRSLWAGWCDALFPLSETWFAGFNH